MCLGALETPVSTSGMEPQELLLPHIFTFTSTSLLPSVMGFLPIYRGHAGTACLHVGGNLQIWDLRHLQKVREMRQDRQSQKSSQESVQLKGETTVVWEVEFLGESPPPPISFPTKGTLAARAYLLSIYSPLPSFLLLMLSLSNNN